MYTKKTSWTFVVLTGLLSVCSMALVLWVVHITVSNILKNVVMGKFEGSSGVALTHGVILILGLLSLMYAFLALRESQIFWRDHLYDLAVRISSRYALASICLNPAVLLVLFRFLTP